MHTSASVLQEYLVCHVPDVMRIWLCMSLFQNGVWAGDNSKRFQLLLISYSHCQPTTLWRILYNNEGKKYKLGENRKLGYWCPNSYLPTVPSSWDCYVFQLRRPGKNGMSYFCLFQIVFFLFLFLYFVFVFIFYFFWLKFLIPTVLDQTGCRKCRIFCGQMSENQSVITWALKWKEVVSGSSMDLQKAP